MTDARTRRRIRALARREGIDAATIAARLQLRWQTVEAVLAADRRGERPATLLEAALADSVDDAIEALRAGALGAVATAEPSGPPAREEAPDPIDSAIDRAFERAMAEAHDERLTDAERGVLAAVRAAAAEAGPGTVYQRAAARLGRSAEVVRATAGRLRRRGFDLPAFSAGRPVAAEAPAESASKAAPRLAPPPPSQDAIDRAVDEAFARAMPARPKALARKLSRRPRPVSAEELAGVTVTRCPTAAVEPTTATIPDADRRALQQYGEARAEQAFRERTGRDRYPKQRGER